MTALLKNYALLVYYRTKYQESDPGMQHLGSNNACKEWSNLRDIAMMGGDRAMEKALLGSGFF